MIGMFRNIFLIFFLIFLAFLDSNNLFASSPKNEILCQGWLGKLPGHNEKRSCKKVEDDKESTKGCNHSANPSYSKGDHKNQIYKISDNIGVLGTCRDYFPTFGEREFFYRSSNDPFNIRLVVTRQYCWARFVLDHTTNCGGPKWYFPFNITWKHGPNYALWGDTKTEIFNLDDVEKEREKNICFLNYAHLEYDVMRDKNGNVIKGKDNKSKKNYKRVCAYYTPTFVASIFVNANVIGCVNVPLMPAPPIYNKILVPEKRVVISSKEPEDSTFENPKINLTIKDSSGKEIGPTITLIYDFNKADNNQQCKYLLNQLFCPTFSSLSPDKICAKKKDGSALGCINRKRMAESGIKMEVVHDYMMDNDCNDDPTKPSIFQALRVKLIKPDGSSPPYLSKGSIRDYYACTKKIPNPQNKDKKIEMTTAGFDSVDILGVKFRAFIPKFSKSDPNKFEKAYLTPPQIIGYPTDKFQKSCENCFVISSDHSKGQAYIVPAGKRDRSSCKKRYQCIIDPESKKEENCTFGYNDQYNDAEKAYCHGVYIGADDASTQDKICIALDTKWEGFFGPNDQLCADIPNSYAKLGKDDISAITGYADFSNDGYDPAKTYALDHKFYGECHASLGLQETRDLSEDFQELSPSYTHLMKRLRIIYLFLKGQFNNVNANPPLLNSQLSKLLNLGNLGDFTRQTIDIKRPYRTLDGNFPIGNIHNPCKFVSGKDGCTNSTDTRDFSGNADYTPKNKLVIGEYFEPTADSRNNTNIGIITTDLLIEGKCRAGFSSSTTPCRICRIVTNRYNKIISKAWTNFPVGNPCLK